MPDVVAVPGAPAQYFAGSEVIETCLSAGELRSLGAFLASSFAHDGAGHVVRRSKGIYGDSQFYGGEGRYYLLNTCNKWTAKALSSAGMNIAPTLRLTSGSVMGFLKAHLTAGFMSVGLAIAAGTVMVLLGLRRRAGAEAG